MSDHIMGSGKPGAEWRFRSVMSDGSASDVTSEELGVFDELVVDNWLHIEQMDERGWWMRIGDARVMCFVEPDGTTTVNVERGFYAPARGTTSHLSVPED